MTSRMPLRLGLMLGLCLSLTLGLTLSVPALAAWGAGGSGTASSRAYTMPAGGQPLASASGNSVSVRWPAAVFPDNKVVTGYIIHRFDAASGAQAPVGAGCSGIVPTTTCTELNVPAGTWIYTDTPVQDKWTGTQSPASAPVTVP